jgi:hypothetical protein
MVWVTELITVLLVAGALVLLWAGRIDFQQALTLIGLGLGLTTGKQLARLDRLIDRRYGRRLLMRKYGHFLSAIEVKPDTVTLYVLPEFMTVEIVRTLMAEASQLFPGRTVKVEKGERIKLL